MSKKKENQMGVTSEITPEAVVRGEIFFILDEIETYGKYDEYTRKKLEEIGEMIQ